jgi:ornithine cyclodeaminase/alanine dehydrogenase-like protein (mu-crystallin family)
MLVLKEKDVYSLLSHISPEECHDLLNTLHGILQQYSADREADPSRQTIHQPERISIVTNANNTSLFMPSSITTQTAIKTVTISSSGLKGCINLFGPEGDLRGILNAEEVTAFRTSLAVMIPFIRWPRDKSHIVVFGAGRQAEWHVKLALLLSERVKSVTVVNRGSPRRMERLFSDLQSKYPHVSFNILLKTADAFDAHSRTALSASDVIFCCTPATTPHFPSSYLDSKPRFISLIGSYKPSMQEVESGTLLSGDCIYVDTIEGCLVEAGELIKARVTKDQLVEIGQLKGSEAISWDKNLIFKCVGLGMMDLVMANAILEMARQKNVGVEIDDF